MIFKDPLYDVIDFEYLYDQYAGAVYKIILNETDSAEAANTILQKTFQSLFAQMTTFDSSKCMLFTWLRKTAQDYIITFQQSA